MSDFSLSLGEHDQDAVEELRRGARGAAAWRRRGRVEAASGKLNDQARTAGRVAAERGHGEESCPEYGLPSLAACWLDGFRGVMAERRVDADLAAPAPMADPAAALVGAEERWPDGAPLPTAYRPAVMPCASCRRVRVASGEKAALLLNRKSSIAAFVCRNCGHKWRLPIEPQR